MDTRAKVQITVDRLETEVTELRSELSDLKELRAEVQQLRSEMVTMPKVEQKLAEMNQELNKTLQLILANVTPAKSETITPQGGVPPPNTGINTPPHPIPTSASVVPGISAPAVTRNLQTEFAAMSLAPENIIPGVTTVLPATSLFTDSTHTTTVQQPVFPEHPQFRMTAPAVSNNAKAMAMGFIGNSGYFAPISAPVYNPPHTYNSITRQYINTSTTIPGQPPVYQAAGQLYEAQRNQIATQLGGPSYFAEAVLKGPRLEIPVGEF